MSVIPKTGGGYGKSLDYSERQCRYASVSNKLLQQFLTLLLIMISLRNVVEKSKRNCVMKIWNLGASDVHSALIKSGLMLLVISGCSSNSSMDAGNEPESNLSWTVCEPGSMLECSSLEVPVNYKMPEGEKITIALNRLPATSTEKLGSLVLNPGGPGGSGIDTLQQIVEEPAVPDLILRSYDIIGFDPRGIGDSRPVDCSEFDIDDFNEYPQNAEDIAQLLAQRTTSASLCSDKYGTYLTQLGSLNVVRDMESMRVALGDEKLNFLGFSYGTRLAALYLQEYPAQSGRVILDASMLPASDVLGLSEGALLSMQANLRRLLSFCTQSDPTCNSTELESLLKTRINTLLASEDPLAGEELELLAELVIGGVQEPGIGELAAGPISEYLISGDLSVLIDFVTLLEALTGPEPLEDSDSSTAELAVMCADDATRPDAESMAPLFDRFNAISDLFAESMIAQASMCAGWPAAVEPLSPIAVDTAPIAVVIGGTTDALTPINWGQKMAQSIGAVFVESRHLGHTVLFQDASACADDIVSRFLIEGVLPENAVCALEDD